MARTQGRLAGHCAGHVPPGIHRTSGGGINLGGRPWHAASKLQLGVTWLGEEKNNFTIMTTSLGWIFRKDFGRILFSS